MKDAIIYLLTCTDSDDNPIIDYVLEHMTDAQIEEFLGMIENDLKGTPDEDILRERISELYEALADAKACYDEWYF